MTLTEQLKQLREEYRKTPETIRAAQQLIDELYKLNITEKSLKVGDSVPSFELSNAHGKLVDLSALLNDGPVVISFFRGSWCIFCTAELRSLQQNLFEIMRLKSSLVAISPQTPDSSLLTVEKNNLTFEVLVDANNKVARAFGIAYKVPETIEQMLKENGVNLEDFNGDNSFELPVPATYVVDTDSQIKFAFVEPDYTKRADPVEIIGVLRKLKQQQDSPK